MAPSSSCQSRNTQAFRVTQEDIYTNSSAACFNNIPKIAEWVRNDKLIEGGIPMPGQVTDVRKLQRKLRCWHQGPLFKKKKKNPYQCQICRSGDRMNSCNLSKVLFRTAEFMLATCKIRWQNKSGLPYYDYIRNSSLYMNSQALQFVPDFRVRSGAIIHLVSDGTQFVYTIN